MADEPLMFLLVDIKEEKEEWILTFEPNGKLDTRVPQKNLGKKKFNKAKEMRIKKEDPSQLNVLGLLMLIKERMEGKIK